MGQLIIGPGMEDIVIKSSFDAIELKTTWYDINNIKKAHYTLLVVPVVLMKKLEVAFEKRLLVMVIGKTGSLLTWYYTWRQIKVVFLEVQSFREAIIDLLIAVIEGIDSLSLH